MTGNRQTEGLRKFGLIFFFRVFPRGGTQDDAVEIYARYLMGRHGKSAHHYARKTADKLKREGDLEGYSAWSRVADAVERKAG